MLTAYKLFTVRKDGTIGSLFINRRRRVPLGVWLEAEDHPTRGYAHRPGWHAASEPVAPHLHLGDGRRWFKVLVKDVVRLLRPESQGGMWYIAKKMKVIGPI